MKLDPYIGDVIVEVAFSTVPDDPSPVYVDVTDYVAAGTGITITRGRQDEYSTCNPATCTLTLDNTNGYFTSGYAGSPWYPNVKIRKKLRVSTVVGGTTYRRFTGYVEEWPTEWPDGGDYSIVQVTAVDRFKRLGTIAKFKPILQQEFLLDTPVAWYPFTDAAGSTVAVDATASGNPNAVIAGSGAALAFGAAGPGPFGDTALQLAGGQYLTVPFSRWRPSFVLVPTWTFEICVKTTGNTYAVLFDDLGGQFQLSIDASGKPWFFSWNGTTAVNDGAWHHIAATYTKTGSTATRTLYVDGVQEFVDTTSGADGSFYSGNLLFGHLSSNLTGLNSFVGSIDQFAAYNTALSATRVAAHAAAVLTAFAGERSDQRIARYASYCGIPTAEQNLEVGLSTSIAAVDITGQAPSQAMQAVTDTENGVLFIDGQGRLAFQSRGHRYNSTSALTLAGEDVAPSTKFVSNDALMVNDVTASRAGGITYRATNAQSIIDNGTVAVNPVLLTTSDNEVIDAANWKANQTATIVPRLPNVTVDILTNPNIAAAVLALEIGSRFTLGTLPRYAPAASADWFIEGAVETISETGYVFTFNTSPAAQFSVWVLDSATYSQLGSTTRLAY